MTLPWVDKKSDFNILNNEVYYSNYPQLLLNGGILMKFKKVITIGLLSIFALLAIRSVQAADVASTTIETAQKATEEISRFAVTIDPVKLYKAIISFIDAKPKTAFGLGIAGTIATILTPIYYIHWTGQQSENSRLLQDALYEDFHKPGNKNQQTANDCAINARFFPFIKRKLLETLVTDFYSSTGVKRKQILDQINKAIIW